MSDDKIYPVPAEWSARAWVDDAKYQEMYQQSISDPEGFWGEMGKRVEWTTPYTKVKNTTYDAADLSIKWYEDGRLNVCLSADGHVYTWGQSRLLGHGIGVAQHLERPRRITSLTGIVHISANAQVFDGHVLATSCTGVVYSWGDGISETLPGGVFGH